MRTSEEYHEYIGGCSIHRGDIMMHVGDTMSTSGGCHDACTEHPPPDILNTPRCTEHPLMY